MTRDDMFQVAKDFCSDMGIRLEEIEPRVFYYGVTEECVDTMRVKSDALSGCMECWADEISTGFLSEPQCEGFFVVLSILEFGTDRDLLLVSEQLKEGRVRTFTLDLDGNCADANYPTPTFLENIALVVH